MAMPRVLIVEDQAETRATLAFLFICRGWSVLAAATLGEGRAMLACRPDCVLIDLMLPDGDGSQLLRQIREEGLPIRMAAVVTGIGDTRRLEAADSLRPDATFMKPVDPGILLDACVDALAAIPSART